MGIETLTLVGGNICLDFMNTVGDHLTDHPGEWLETYIDLLAWARRAGVITDEEVARLSRQSERYPRDAADALARAIALREAIYRILLSAVRRQPPEAADLLAFNRALVEAPARTEVVYDGEKYIWQQPEAVHSLDYVLWRILWSAADLLTSEQLAQVKVCEGEGCGWVFLDTSRNQARRWCSMADCGNRAKASRYYQRHKSD